MPVTCCCVSVCLCAWRVLPKMVMHGSSIEVLGLQNRLPKTPRRNHGQHARRCQATDNNARVPFCRCGQHAHWPLIVHTGSLCAEAEPPQLLLPQVLRVLPLDEHGARQAGPPRGPRNAVLVGGWPVRCR